LYVVLTGSDKAKCDEGRRFPPCSNWCIWSWPVCHCLGSVSRCSVLCVWQE